MGEDDDEITKNMPLWQKALRMCKKFLTQYNIFFVFIFKVFCEWYFGARITQQQREEAEAQTKDDGKGGRTSALIKVPKEVKPTYSKYFKAGTCAFCKNNLLNPCVLESSGFAFCYGCISV